MNTLLLVLSLCTSDTTSPVHQFRDTIPQITVSMDSTKIHTLLGQKKWDALMELIRKSDSIKAEKEKPRRRKKDKV
jgi:hypothetical protein